MVSDCPPLARPLLIPYRPLVRPDRPPAKLPCLPTRRLTRCHRETSPRPVRSYRQSKPLRLGLRHAQSETNQAHSPPRCPHYVELRQLRHKHLWSTIHHRPSNHMARCTTSTSLPISSFRLGDGIWIRLLPITQSRSGEKLSPESPRPDTQPHPFPLPLAGRLARLPT